MIIGNKRPVVTCYIYSVKMLLKIAQRILQILPNDGIFAIGQVALMILKVMGLLRMPSKPQKPCLRSVDLTTLTHTMLGICTMLGAQVQIQNLKFFYA